jgi:hypothetical protein
VFQNRKEVCEYAVQEATEEIPKVKSYLDDTDNRKGEETVQLLRLDVLGPPAGFPSELIWNYGSDRHSVGLLGRAISPSQGRYLHRTTPTQKKRGQTSMARVGFEPAIPMFEREKTFRALDRGVTVIGTSDVFVTNLGCRRERTSNRQFKNREKYFLTFVLACFFLTK